MIVRKSTLAAVVAMLALLPAIASAHPPVLDPHNSCVVKFGKAGSTSPLDLVTGTLSYLAPLGNLKCPSSTKYGLGPIVSEWGSHADMCPPPPFEGAVNGAYCGPVVPPWPATATCSWFPVLNTVRTQLIIGFDGFVPPGAPGMDGLVNFATTAGEEYPVYGPFPPAANPLAPTGWTVPNPYPVPARVIAFPTNVAGGVLAPGDLNLVQCD